MLSLDLTRAIEIQHEVAKKLIEKHNKQEGHHKPIDNEKFAQMEQENMRLTNMLQTEFSNYKVVKKDNNKLRNLNKELLAINQMLASSIKQMRESNSNMQDELNFLRTDRSLVLRTLLREGPEAVGLEKTSELAKFLVDLAQIKPYVPNLIDSGYTDGHRDNQTRLQPKLSLKEVREYAQTLNKDVKKLPLHQMLSKGKQRIASERVHHVDDVKAWSFHGDQEANESISEERRGSLESERMLEGI